jgi:hypothetical protein
MASHQELESGRSAGGNAAITKEAPAEPMPSPVSGMERRHTQPDFLSSTDAEALASSQEMVNSVQNGEQDGGNVVSTKDE